MATIKSYTDIEQSKKLAKILPLESADFVWLIGHLHTDGPRYEMIRAKGEVSEPENYWPCWSLAALLNVLPTLDDRNANFCKDIRYDKWHVYYHSTATLPIIDTDRHENLVDACYEMILKLNELNLL